MNEKTLINRINDEIIYEKKFANPPIILGLTSFDREMLKLEKSYKIQKNIRRTVIVVAGTLIASLAGIKLSSGEIELEPLTIVEKSVDENDESIVKNLTEYSITLQEFEDIINQNNHSQLEEVTKRMELVTQTRNLANTADLLINEKVKEILNIQDSKIEIFLTRKEKNITGPVDIITIKLGQEVIFTYTNSSKEIEDIETLKEEIQSYQGTGEKQIWEKEIEGFKNKGNKLYNTMVSLLEKDLYFENGNIYTNKGKNI